MSTVIINGIEYVPAKTVTGTRAAAEPVDVRHLDRSFRFDPDAQQHIPTLLVEFEPVSAVGGGDPKAKGWRDRDLLAMMLRGQPTAHIAPAEQPQPETVPVAEVRDGVLVRSSVPTGYTGPLYLAPPPSTPCPHIRSSGVGDHATHWCALNGPPSAPEPSRTLTQDERDVFDAAERRSTKVVVPEPSKAQVGAAWRAIPASHEDSRVSVITKVDVWVMLCAAAAARGSK